MLGAARSIKQEKIKIQSNPVKKVLNDWTKCVY